MRVNRITRHLDPPAPQLPPKEDLKGRYHFVSDSVLRAVAAVTKLLDNEDTAVVMKAAKMILDLEKTRMRHGQRIIGVQDPDYLDTLKMLGPLPADVPHTSPTPEVAAELARIQREELDDMDYEEDEDDEPGIRPIPYVMGVAPATLPPPPPPPPPAVKPPDPDDDDDPALTGEEEYQRWVTGYYYRDRTAAPVGSTGLTKPDRACTTPPSTAG